MPRIAILLFTFFGLAPKLAHAGDPEAHTAAAVLAVQEVAAKDEFKNGVGAPKKDGVVQPGGRFNIPTGGSAECAYAPMNPYGVGCAYASIAGQAVNEPDNWKCIDPRQPELMNQSNSLIGPFTTQLATALAAHISEVAMVCNWNHFVDNSVLPLNRNMDASSVSRVIREWTKGFLTEIEEKGATEAGACDTATFEKHFRRVLNEIHYAQDSVCEHHKQGNVVCSNIDAIPVFNMSPLHDFAQARACMTWLVTTIQSLTGEGTARCDEAVVKGAPPEVELNDNMDLVANMCGFRRVANIYLNAGVPVGSLACMGLERTLRHHCALDPAKTLQCAGPGSDHSDATSNQTYCEGERFPAPGGQDFIGAAKAASVPILEEGMRAWAETCKEPDDPCDPDQCKNWCHRSRGKKVDGGDFTGYCLNSGAPDDSCELHECLCAFVEDCGDTGKQCCQTGPRCKSENDECGRSTGTCIEKGTDACMPELTVEIVSLPAELPTDESVGVAAHIVEPIPMGSKVTWNWEHAGVGSTQAVDGIAGDTNRESTSVRFNTGGAEGGASFNVSASITQPERGVLLAISPTATTYVKKGLTQIVMQASGGVFACSDTKACGVSEYAAYLVPRFEKATGYTAVLSNFGYPSCNRTVSWISPKGDGGGCDFPVTYHPHNSAGPTDMWAVWTGFGGPWDGSPKCEVTITLAP